MEMNEIGTELSHYLDKLIMASTIDEDGNVVVDGSIFGECTNRMRMLSMGLLLARKAHFVVNNEQ